MTGKVIRDYHEGYEHVKDSVRRLYHSVSFSLEFVAVKKNLRRYYFLTALGPPLLQMAQATSQTFYLSSAFLLFLFLLGYRQVMYDHCLAFH
jgi:hypothetical protein